MCLEKKGKKRNLSHRNRAVKENEIEIAINNTSVRKKWFCKSSYRKNESIWEEIKYTNTLHSEQDLSNCWRCHDKIVLGMSRILIHKMDTSVKNKEIPEEILEERSIALNVEFK